MAACPHFEPYMIALLKGDRKSCRTIANTAADQIHDSGTIYESLLWPAMERIDTLYRADRINDAVEHIATRINRMVADQIQMRLVQKTPNGKRMLIASADGEPEELGAQMLADLLESRGWEVTLLGGRVPDDEVLTLVGQLRPDILTIYGTQPSGVPAVRKLIDLIRGVGTNPTMNIMVSGGVFNRADSLWLEVNADLFAEDIRKALTLADGAQPRPPQADHQHTTRRRRRRRRPPTLQPV